MTKFVNKLRPPPLSMTHTHIHTKSTQHTYTQHTHHTHTTHIHTHHTHTNTYTHTPHTQTYKHAHTTHTQTLTSNHTRTYTQTHTSIHTHMHTHTSTHTHTHTTHTHTTHTSTHTHTHYKPIWGRLETPGTDRVWLVVKFLMKVRCSLWTGKRLRWWPFHMLKPKHLDNAFTHLAPSVWPPSLVKLDKFSQPPH